MSMLGQKEADAIDALAASVCSSPLDFDELPQLRTLFNTTFQSGLEAILQKALNHDPAGKPLVEVTMGWIDKMPLASSAVFGQTANFRDKRVELGDAILVTYDNLYTSTGELLRQDARAVLLQAKVARQVGHLKTPKVPLTTNSGSALKELTLLSTWPKFDLFKSSGNSDPLLSNINLGALRGNPSRFAWYVGAPGIAPPSIPAWKSWWVAGAPKHRSSMDASIGQLFVAFLTNQMLRGSPIGEAFKRNGSDDWSKVCKTVLGLVKGNPAPAFLFGTQTDRYTTISIHALAFLSAGAPTFKPRVVAPFVGMHLHDASTAIQKLALGAPRHRTPSLGSDLSRRWRPVLTVTTTRIEGRTEDELE